MSRDAVPADPDGPVAVLGAGAWGLALTGLLARSGAPVRLWTRRPERATSLVRERGGPTGRSGASLPPSVRTTSDLAEAVDGAWSAFLVVPNAGLPDLLASLEALRDPPAGFVSCSKGLLPPRLERPSERVAASFPGRPVAVLSGPNLAGEIAAGLPAATTVASRDAAFARRVQERLNGGTFRVYSDDDPAGLEVAGAYKNVIALAAGMSDALGLGENAKAALLARGLAETARLVRHLGGRERTLYGLGGVGDLIATCASGASRNHRAGARLARGATPAELRAEGLTAEGLPTVAAVEVEARRAALDLPIAFGVAAVARGERSATAALDALLDRAPRDEWDAGGARPRER